MPSDPASGDPEQPFRPDERGQPMGRVGTVLLTAYFVSLSIGAGYTLIGIWPGADDAQIDFKLIGVALLSGALGSFIHSAASFTTYVGNRQLIRSWGLWYVLRPFVGMALALLFYFLIRGGFLAPGASGKDISAYGIAGVAGLVGMFSKQATDKLKELFDNLFNPTEDQHRADKLTAAGGSTASATTVAASHQHDPGA